jgi:xylulokinase
MHILALDVGTSSVKAAVLEAATGHAVGPVARSPYELEAPTPEAAEISVERLWEAIAGAARAATRQVPDVEGVGLSVMTPALVLLDGSDQPCAPIWTHLDRRSRPTSRRMWAAVGAEFLATVGNRPLPGGISAVCYLQQLQDKPYLSHRVKRYLHLNGWLALRLTGQAAFDPANASFTGLYGTLTDQKWSPHWCDYFGVEPEWLPPVLSGGDTVGELRSAAAAELGVPAGIPVKLGTADTSCAMLAARVVPGDLLHVVGTTQVLAVHAPDPRPNPRRLTRQLGVGRSFIYLAHNPVGGVALEWLHRLCFQDQSEEEFFQKTVPEAEKHRPRASFDPPFLGGDRLEIEAHRAAFRDLELTTDRLDLLAALLEAMRRRHNEAVAALDQSEPFHRVVLTGRGAEVVHHLIPGYESAAIQVLQEASLYGVARLFDGTAGGSK